MRIALITGASGGLGAEFARQIDRDEKEIDEIWLTARREEKLRELASRLAHGTRIIPADLADRSACGRIGAMLSEAGAEVGILVVCAGFGKVGTSVGIGRDASAAMIDLNCRAAVDVTLTALPFMGAGDRILEICSTSAFQPFPCLGVYAASKAFLYSYSRALRQELMPRKIAVTAVCPYWIRDTEFIETAEDTSGDGRRPVRHYLFAGKASPTARRALRDSRIGLAVSTPGIICSLHRLFAKLVPRNVMMLIWEGLRRL